MQERGRRTSGCIGLTFKLHGCDKTRSHGEYVKNFAAGKNIPFNVLDELPHSDVDPASITLHYAERFDIWIELPPLPSPVGADFFFPHNLAALRSLGQLTSSVISANAPPMSRLLNAEYACSIIVLVSAIQLPISLAMHSILSGQQVIETESWRERRDSNSPLLHAQPGVLTR